VIGQKVVVFFRKRETAGHYLGIVDDRILVLHDGQDRKFQGTSVRHPRPGEFPNVADNINEPVGV